MPKEALINRYYQVVEEVLDDYRDQVADLQKQLTDYLAGHGQVEFLRLDAQKVSPSTYQQRLRERNKKMVNYVEDHPEQEKAVRSKYDPVGRYDDLSGVRYWDNFIQHYRYTLDRLLKKNERVHTDFKFACRYAKPIAQQIGKAKPAYLSGQNVVDLRTIYSGIKDEQALEDELKQFRNQVNATLKGSTGEKLVRNEVQAYPDNYVLSSLNLPYSYRKGVPNSNQIDCLVVNQKGIFILEIKNYIADTIGIDQDGVIVTERYGKTQRYENNNIIRQGQNHYNAVLDILKADEGTKYHLGYLKKQVHVLYVSTNPHTKIKPAEPGASSYYHFVSLDGLRRYIDQQGGQLRREIIQAVVEAIDNRQQAEKIRSYFCFPAKPDKQVQAAWQQYEIMCQLLKLKLDDFVKKEDPDIIDELDQAGLKACDGYVTNKPRKAYNGFRKQNRK